MAVLVRLPGGAGRVMGDTTQADIEPLEGPPEVLAEVFRAYARAGIGHLQLVLDPVATASIEALAPVLEALDGA